MNTFGPCFTRIRELALENPKEEVCGFLVRPSSANVVEVFPAKNEARNPEEDFEIPLSALIAARQVGTILATYHSHPKGKLEFSAYDHASSAETRLPGFLYSVPDDDLILHRPDGYNFPLDNRPFVPLLFDCFSFVVDYYAQVLNIPAKGLVERKASSWNKFYAQLLPFYEANGLKIDNRPKLHDVVVMTDPHTRRPSHAAIYSDSGMIHHQRTDNFSEKIPYGGYWEKITSYFLRHPKFL